MHDMQEFSGGYLNKLALSSTEAKGCRKRGVLVKNRDSVVGRRGEGGVSSLSLFMRPFLAGFLRSNRVNYPGV